MYPQAMELTSGQTSLCMRATSESMYKKCVETRVISEGVCCRFVVLVANAWSMFCRYLLISLRQHFCCVDSVSENFQKISRFICWSGDNVASSAYRHIDVAVSAMRWNYQSQMSWSAHMLCEEKLYQGLLRAYFYWLSSFKYTLSLRMCFIVIFSSIVVLLLSSCGFISLIRFCTSLINLQF